jgi:solute carrier family 45 protein 1/2/4
LIKGIHNISIVIPQFIVTGIAALIFAIFDPQNASTLAHRGDLVQAQTLVTNGTDGKVFPTNATESFERAVRSIAVNLLEIRQEVEDSTDVYQGSNSVVYIFRFGGIAAMIAAVLAWRLARDLRHR